MAGRIEEDLFYSGAVVFANVTVNDGSITNAKVAASAAIAASKLEHRHSLMLNQPNSAATTETRAVFHCYGAAGTVVSVYAGSIVAAIGAATVTVDVKKNGTTILSGVITLDNTNTAYLAEAGTITVPALVAGDVLTVVITATAGGGTLPTGLFVSLRVNEDAN